MSPEKRAWTDEEMSFKEIPENPARVDFTGCRDIFRFHQILKEQLGLPEYYGENMDALWDLVSDFRDYPITIELHGLGDLPKEFDNTVKKMLKVFDDVHKESPHVEFVRVS